MIKKLKIKNKISVYLFLEEVKDIYNDFYITIDKYRKHLKGDWSLIEKILENYEVYGLENNGLKVIMIIIRNKGFRSYVRLLAENKKYAIDMLKFLKWNFSEETLYMKLKRDNPLSKMIYKTGFIKIGNRGKEDLFEKKAIKQLHKLTPKDIFLENK